MGIKGRTVLVRIGIVFCGLLPAVTSSAFGQTKASNLSVASVSAALASERAAIAADPKNPTNFVNLAYTLTDAGIGEQAQAAAVEATRVAPASSFAFSAQGWVLHHNDIGIDYGSGFDYDGALRSFQKAIELAPQDLDVRQSLANLLEIDRDGVRYAPDAQLGLAIAAYRYVKEHQPMFQAEVVDNLAIDLFYAGSYDDAVRELTGISGTNQRLGIVLASVAASKGSAAAIEVSSRIDGDEQRRKDALNFRAEGLWNKRFYAAVAELLTASLPDTAGGAAVSAKIQIFRNLKPFTPADLPTSDPRQPVQRLLESAFAGKLDDALVKELVSRHSYATDAAWNGASQQSEALSGKLTSLMKQTGLPRAVVADIVLNRMSVTAAPNSGTGVAVRVQVIGLAPIQFFDVLENGAWKLAATGRDPGQAGAQALWLLQTGNTNCAGLLLNWYYSLLEPSGEAGDPLGGDLFTRLWNPSVRADRQAPLFAAAALTTDANLLRPLVPEVVKAAQETSAKNRRDDLDMLLATVFLRLQNAPNSVAVTSRLLAEYPQSNTALKLAGRAYGLERNWVAWKALLAKQLKTDPHQLLLENAAEAEAEGDYTRARQSYQRILDGSRPSSEDYSMYAWLSLFEGKPDNRALAAAQQAAMNENNRRYPSLLALACVHAAREILPKPTKDCSMPCRAQTWLSPMLESGMALGGSMSNTIWMMLPLRRTSERYR